MRGLILHRAPGTHKRHLRCVGRERPACSFTVCWMTRLTKIIMKSCRSFITLWFTLILSACTTAGRAPDALESSLRATDERLTNQEQQLEIQRNQLAAVEGRNAELTQALFDLQQELANLKQDHLKIQSQAQKSAKPAARKSARPAASSRVRQQPQVDESGKIIVGTAEWVWFDLLGRSVAAKTDARLKSSTIYSNDIQLFERNGDQWVRFVLALSDEAEEGRVAYEAPLLRRVKVRPANGGEVESRPVVRLKIKLGEVIDDPEFVLVNRDPVDFAVVLGRSFLRDIAVVDEKQKFTQPKHTENSSL